MKRTCSGRRYISTNLGQADESGDFMCGKDTPIVLIGAGNLATNLGKALYRKGFCVAQVYSRTEESARTLAEQLDAGYTCRLDEVRADAALYVVAVKDDALDGLLPGLVAGKADNALFVHTAGSVPLSIWEGYATRYGVFYPLQTFSRLREVDFSEIPIFVEAASEADCEWLRNLASVLSEQVYVATSEQRRRLHLAAVFACNFTNRMYALAQQLVERSGIPFEVLLPLIDETARKVHAMPPVKAQTGPAVRYDLHVIEKHMDMLADEPDMRLLYELISKNIHQQNKEKL